MDQSDLDPGTLPVDETDELYRLIADTIPQIIWSARADGSGEFHNARASEYYGIDASQLAGIGWQAVVHPDDLPGCLASWSKAVADGTPFSFEYRLRRKDGAWRWHLSKGLPLRDRHGNIVRWFGTATDIDDHKRDTERLEAQVRERSEALHASGLRYRQLIEVAPEAIFVHSDERVVLANPAMVLMFGAQSAEQLIGRKVLELVAPGSRQMVAERIRQLYEAPQSVPLAEFEYLRLDGTPFSVEATAISFSYAGRPAAQVVARDITLRKAAERALRESEQRFRALTELSSDWYWEQDADLRFVGTAGRTALRAGISEADHVGKRRWELPRTEILGQSWDEHKAALASRAPFRDLMLTRTAPDGSAHYVSVCGEPRFAANGTFAGYHGVATDVTARHRAESALRETEARLRLTLDSTPGAIYFYDCEERIVMANHGYADLMETPLTDMAGRTIREIAGEEAYAVAEPYIRRALAGEATTYERRRPRKDGSARDLRIDNVPHRDESGQVTGACALIIDITALKESQQALGKSEARFRGLADLWADWYWEQDENYRFTFLSIDLERSADLSTKAALAKTRWELPTIGVTEAQWATHRADLDAHRPFHDFEYRRLNAAGDLIWLSASGVPVFDDTGRFVGYHGIGRNITQRKRAEAALQESEARFRSLTTLSSDFYWETDAEHRFRLLEYGAKHQALHPRQYLIGKTRWEVESTSPDAEGWRKHRATLDAHLAFRDFEFSRSREDGVIFHYSISGEPMFGSAGVFLGYRGVGRDVTERIRGERALRDSERRIRALLRRLTAAQEAERRRIAADLHDFVGQNLTALGVALETFRVVTGEAREIPSAPTLEEMAGLLRDTMDSVRQVMSDLRPPLLDDYGLVAALESHARHFASRTGLAVSVEGERTGLRPAPNVELALFRIAQEALANALKHAGATSARVVLASRPGFLRLSIEDNGSGFAQPSGARAEHRGGWGLPLMRERAEGAGGTLRIEFPARGTRVVAEVPHVDSNHPG
ncbi:MAG TPA: PAS domain S-box protein [Burkholderiales bacterium]|nr:PAS domain S-box protein [Burkholderiales bacterium]